MKILFVSHVRKDPDAGSSRVYHLLEEGLAARGHSVKTLHYDDFEICQRFARIVNRVRLPQAASHRAEKERPNEYDIIMSSSGMLYPLFRRLKEQENRPLLVSHLHGLALFDHQAVMDEVLREHVQVSWMYKTWTGPLHAKYDFLGATYADLTIVQNGLAADALAERGFAPITTIPLCVHPEILDAGASSPTPESRGPFSFLWFGSWLERKGSHYLPSAFEQIVQRYPTATLTIGGTGIPAEELKRKFAPKVRTRVTVLPYISRAEQIELFGKHAVFLFPSLSEGFGFALMEAMSLGLAALTTETGLAGDYLMDRENAIIVPKASALHIAKGASFLLENNERRCSIARAGQSLARTFTLDKFVDAYEAAFLQHLRR